MSFDLNIPQLELRLLIAIMFKDLFSDITTWLRIEFKIPWFKNWFLVYKHVRVVEFATLPRKQCWRLIFLNKKIRDFYDSYPTLEECNEQKVSS